MRPKIKDNWSDAANFCDIGHGIGIDTGEALILRGGVRDNHDLISTGKAPNHAAKLSEIRDYHDLAITQAVYEAMSDDVAFMADGTPLWTKKYHRNPDGFQEVLFRSSASWGV